MSNRLLFERLVAERRLNVEPAAFLDREPPPHERPVSAEGVRGMLLGLAIGDALGNTSESLLPGERRLRHSEIRDYLPNERADGRCVGLPSDDTQLAFWTLEQLVERGGLDVDDLARRFNERRIFGIGQSLSTFLRMAADFEPLAITCASGATHCSALNEVLEARLKPPKELTIVLGSNFP